MIQRHLYERYSSVGQCGFLERVSITLIDKTDPLDPFFFSICVYFHEHSPFTEQQGKREALYVTPLYHFHPLHRHLDISRAELTSAHS